MESTDFNTLCEHCHVSCADKGALRRHKYEHHSVPDPISFQGGILTVERTGENGVMILKCPISDCQRIYQTRSKFLQHIASHQGDLPGGAMAVSFVEDGSEGSGDGRGRPVFPLIVSVADLIDCAS
jgi:hypothetical protein